jgi:hypothetical protein
MKRAKLLQLSFLILLLLDIIILSLKSISAKTILTNANADFTFVSFNELQKPIGMISIIFFIGLLILASWLYFSSGRKLYVYMATLVYVGFTLFNYITLTRIFFNIGGQFERQSGSYWLIVCIGLFYVVGGIVVAAIGLNTVRNLHHRSKERKNTEHGIS